MSLHCTFYCLAPKGQPRLIQCSFLCCGHGEACIGTMKEVGVGTLLPLDNWTWLGRPGCFAICPVLRGGCDSLSARGRLEALLAAVQKNLSSGLKPRILFPSF